VSGPSLEVDPGAVDVTELADRVLEVVPRTMRLIRGEMRARGRGELSVAQLRVLLRVRRRPGIGLSAVADHVGISMPAASALVDRLVRAGLVERSADPDERRRIQLRLTPAGTERVALAQLAVRTWLTGELAELGAADLRALASALGVLEHLTGREPGAEA